MSRSPFRVFFLIALLFTVLGLFVTNIHNKIDWFGINNFPPSQDLNLARHYWSTGQAEKAIAEYKQAIQDTDTTTSFLAEKELGLLIAIEGDSQEKFIVRISNAIWILPQNLFSLGFVFFGIWLLALITKAFIKKPLFAILPIKDTSGMDISEAIPQIAMERMREVVWRMKTLETTTSLITESLEMPILGMTSEGNSIDSIALIETAVMFSGGPNNLPLFRFFNSLRIWLEQPKYLVNGNISKWKNTLYIHINVVNKKTNTIEDAWSSEIDINQDLDGISEMVDVLIYPLLFKFSKNLDAKKWEAVKYLHDGLQEFQLYRNKGYSLEHLNRARNQMEKSLSFDPTYVLAKNNLGLLLLRSGDYEGARDLFREISNSTIKGNRNLGLYNYGVALFYLSQDWAYKRAFDTFQNIITNSSDIDDEFINLVRSSLAMTCARLLARNIQDNEKYAVIAIEGADKVLTSDHASEETKANALSAKGFVSLARKEYSQSKSIFSHAIEKYPENPICYIGLGEVLLQLGIIDDALEAFKNAKFLSPTSGYCNFRLGNIYRKQGDIEKALKEYLDAPEFALAHLEVGKILLINHEYNNALDEFRTATQLNKRLGEAWVNIAWVICETKTTNDNLLKEAEKSARRGLQLERNKDQLWHRHSVLARVLLIQGKKEYSLKEALESVKAGAERAQAYYYLAEAEYQSGQYDKAFKSLKKVLELKGDEWHIAAELLLDQMDKNSSSR